MEKSVFLRYTGRRVVAFACAVLLTFAVCGAFTGCSPAEKLYLFNYGDYIDPQVYDLFEQETGIRVVRDEYDAPESMYAKFATGGSSYDLICSSDYMLEKLIKEERLAPLNKENIPNLSNIAERQWQATEAFDAGAAYTVPHFWGTLGILYDTKKVSAEEVKSWNVLFDGSHAGNIIMPDSERDAFFVALTKLGYDTNTTDEAQLREASELLKKQKADVKAYLLDESARSKVEAGIADMAVIYNGEAYLAFENNADLAFAIPEDGTCVWVDSFAVPKDAAHPEYAEKFLDFLCREDIAMMNFEYIYYSTPNQAVIDALDEELLAETAIFPEDSIHENAAVLKYLGAEVEALYSELWKNVKS